MYNLLKYTLVSIIGTFREFFTAAKNSNIINVSFFKNKVSIFTNWDMLNMNFGIIRLNNASFPV